MEESIVDVIVVLWWLARLSVMWYLEGVCYG
jgi:hypothetical protein